jgi:GNAT superfamily N-acetyltransferase
MAKPKTCPKMVIHRSPQYGPRGVAGLNITITSPTGKKIYGFMEVEHDGPDHTRPSMIHVDPNHRRCGIGTRLYAAAFACDENRTLGSDSQRTAFSEGFWQKQVNKGRARCATEWAHRVYADPTQAAPRGGCEYYVLTAPCPAPKLDRRRRKTARRPLLGYRPRRGFGLRAAGFGLRAAGFARAGR